MFSIEQLFGDRPYLWLRCDTCIAGVVMLPLPHQELRLAVQTALYAQAQQLGWELQPQHRCPLCVEQNWTDPIPVFGTHLAPLEETNVT